MRKVMRKLRLPDDKEKYSNKWHWIELGKYSKSRDKVFRITDKKSKKPITVDYTTSYDFADKNDRLGIYTSVFHYNMQDYEKATRLGSVYFDLDNKDTSIALRETIEIVEMFYNLLSEEQLRIYFTGKKGFHIEAEALAVGVTPSNDLPYIYKLIANDLKEKFTLDSIDFAVYDLRRMWRLPNTIHQSTGLYKVPLTYQDLDKGMDHILQKAKTPVHEEVEEQDFSFRANQWFKEYSYKYEESLIKHTSIDDAIALFNKNGSVGVHKDAQAKHFNAKALFQNCSAMMRLWEKAESQHHLEHEERLFLCSILSYTPEAIEYLHSILSLCSDYDYYRTKSHIDDWIIRREKSIGGRPYSCRRANDGGVGCGDCSTKMDRKKKWVQVGDSYVESEEYAEPSPIRFAYSK